MKLILALILSLSVGLEYTDSVGGVFQRARCDGDVHLIQKGFILLLCAAPILCTHFVSPSQNQVSFSCDLGCVLVIVSPILYCNDYGDELKITLPPIC